MRLLRGMSIFSNSSFCNPFQKNSRCLNKEKKPTQFYVLLQASVVDNVYECFSYLVFFLPVIA